MLMLMGLTDRSLSSSGRGEKVVRLLCIVREERLLVGLKAQLGMR